MVIKMIKLQKNNTYKFYHKNEPVTVGDDAGRNFMEKIYKGVHFDELIIREDGRYYTIHYERR